MDRRKKIVAALLVLTAGIGAWLLLRPRTASGSTLPALTNLLAAPSAAAPAIGQTPATGLPPPTVQQIQATATLLGTYYINFKPAYEIYADPNGTTFYSVYPDGHFTQYGAPTANTLMAQKNFNAGNKGV